MATYTFDTLRRQLHDRFGDDLRWVASFDSERYDYEFHYVREGLRTELRDRDLDFLIHRSLAVFNRRHVEEVYFHLGAAGYLVTNYEKGTAFHIYLDDDRGAVVMLEPDVEVSLPGFVEQCRRHLDAA